jgi:hypothetical protein
MNFLYNIIFHQRHARDGNAAIIIAQNHLESKICPMKSSAHDSEDFFIIGGRYSGRLTIAKLGQRYFESLRDINVRNGYSHQANKQRLQMNWELLGQDGIHPLLRDTYASDGPHLDDAAIIDQNIFNHIKHSNNNYDLDGDIISEDNLIDKKWIVIADIHRQMSQE